MRVSRLVMVTPTHAVAHLEPSWVERLGGDRPTICELERVGPDHDMHWRSRHTGQCVPSMPHGRILLYALAFHPVVDENEMVRVPLRLLKGVDD